MSSFAILLLCIQACLVQNAFSACYGNYGAGVINNAGLGYGSGVAAIAPAAGCGGYAAGLGYANGLGLLGNAGVAEYGAGYQAAYGGTGEGNVAVIGELPIAGNTAVAGQVPIQGVVSFGGNVPAAGAVSISGNCACGCGAVY